MSEINISEVLLEELRLLRKTIEAKDKEHREEIRDLYGELKEMKKDISTLKSRFMMVALTMGLAGGKLGAILPFLK